MNTRLLPVLLFTAALVSLSPAMAGDPYPGTVPGFGYGMPHPPGGTWGERRNFIPPPQPLSPLGSPLGPPLVKPQPYAQPGPFDDLLEKHGLGTLRTMPPVRPVYPDDRRYRDPYRRPQVYNYYPPSLVITLSQCQQAVGDSLRNHLGAGTLSFSGGPQQGIVSLGQRSFNYRCAYGRVNIW